MTKLELFTLLSLGFLIFEVLFIRVGFFLGYPITSFTLLLSYLLYTSVISIIFSFNILPISMKNMYFSLVLFFIVSIIVSSLIIPLSYTFDLSWDGQGYHQTAVIALSNGWNPILTPEITLEQRLPSQIFAEGYPSALWEIESSIYAITGKINTAKIVNFIIAIISGTMAYSLLRKLRFGKVLATITSLLIIIQPVYVIQLLTFMQDGFGYQLLVIALSSLTLFIVSPKSYWAILVFIFAEILLVSTKYSHLPIAFILGIIFAVVVVNRYLNNEYSFTPLVKSSLVALVVITSVLAYLPYVRNTFAYHAPFYPTNIPALMGAVRYNNVPTNLADKDKFSLLFYGIFSRAQSGESGDPRSPSNIAQLKIPFMFSDEEITDAASLFNNRAGSGGPIFSGIVILALGILIFMSFKTTSVMQRYSIYGSFFAIGVILFLSLLAPTPNLLRYVNQLQLLPFLVVIPLYAMFNKFYVKAFVILLLVLITVNTSLYTAAIMKRNVNEINQINAQFTNMRMSNKKYNVKAQQFYSSYILLQEQQIPFIAVNSIQCKHINEIFASSTTTQFCVK